MSLPRRYGRSARSAEMLADLHRQGFMKPRTVRKKAAPRPTVACDACLNWHPEGKHTATLAQRRANLAAAGKTQATQRPVGT